MESAASAISVGPTSVSFSRSQSPCLVAVRASAVLPCRACGQAMHVCRGVEHPGEARTVLESRPRELGLTEQPERAALDEAGDRAEDALGSVELERQRGVFSYIGETFTAGERSQQQDGRTQGRAVGQDRVPAMLGE